MEELERIKGTDYVPEGFMKADRNFTKLKLEMENVDVSDEIENHNTDEFAHQNIQQEIADLTLQSNEMATDVTNLKTNALQYKTNPSDNVNDFIETGLYRIPSYTTNIPHYGNMVGTNSTEGELTVFRWGIGYFTQRFTSIYGGTVERVHYDGLWRPWKQLATTETTTYPLTPINGFTKFPETWAESTLIKINNMCYFTCLYVSPENPLVGATDITHLPFISVKREFIWANVDGTAIPFMVAGNTIRIEYFDRLPPNTLFLISGRFLVGEELT